MQGFLGKDQLATGIDGEQPLTWHRVLWFHLSPPGHVRLPCHHKHPQVFFARTSGDRVNIFWKVGSPSCQLPTARNGAARQKKAAGDPQEKQICTTLHSTSILYAIIGSCVLFRYPCFDATHTTNTVVLHWI